MANEITTDNINTKAQEVASVGDGDYVYVFKTGAQGFSRIAVGGLVQGGGGNANKVKNIRDNKEYRIWVGSQAQLDALNGVYDNDVIYIVAQEVQGTVIPITSISVTCSKSSSLPNTYNLTATLSPNNTTQTGVLWRIKSGGSYASLSSNGLSATLVVLSGANNNTVVVECYSAAEETVRREIEQAVTYEKPSVDVTITDIQISNTAFQNNKQCTAVFSPSGYSIPVTWSSSDTNVATINSSTGYLTIKSSGTVTIYANSFSKQVTLTYHEEEVPSGDFNFTATRTGANTMTLAATKNGSQVTASYALQGTVPTVKKLQSGVLTDIPAVEISGNTLTYHDDCTVNIVATASGETKTKSITITHDNNDYIWFEDDAALTVIRELNYGSSNGLTYSQAAAITSFKPDGNTSRASVVRFKEFKWFTMCTALGTRGVDNAIFTNWSSLEVVALPSTLATIYATTDSSNPFYGCNLKELHVGSIEEYCSIVFSSTAQSSFEYAGQHENGLSLFVSGSEVTTIIVPNTASGVNKYAFCGFPYITTLEINCGINGAPIDKNSSVSKVIVGNNVTSLPESVFQETGVEDVDLGDGIGALSKNAFRQCYSLEKLTLRYNGVVTIGSGAFYVATGITPILSHVDLYVPQNRYTEYAAHEVWSTARSITSIV